MYDSLEVDQFEESPIRSVISFHLVIEALRKTAQNNTTRYRKEYAQALLHEVEKVPELETGIQSRKLIYDNLELIHYLLEDLFPPALTTNEIKAVSLPFQNFSFNFTQRFQQIIKEAGEAFKIHIRNFDADQYYVLSCCMILNAQYHQNLDLRLPMFYDIPDKEGIIHHYRILFNTDFVEFIPTPLAQKLTQEEIDVLKKNFNNVALWKEKFPKHSWLLKGFGIINLVDVTIENAISILKSSLIKSGEEKLYHYKLREAFKSIFKIADIDVGVHFINKEDHGFIDIAPNVDLTSYFKYDKDENPELTQGYNQLLNAIKGYHGFYSISDINDIIENPEMHLYGSYLQKKNIQSCIIAPLVSVNGMECYIEIVSCTKFALNSINATKLQDVMPLINDTFERVQNDITNYLDAIIQREYTSIHPSVYWKFIQESKEFYSKKSELNPSHIKEIAFSNVYPIYGETDIKGSTKLRNKVTQEDLSQQLTELQHLLSLAREEQKNLLFAQRLDEIAYFLAEIKSKSNAQLELQIQLYITEHIHPVLKQLDNLPGFHEAIAKYKSKLDTEHEKYYVARKKYDETLRKVNKNLINIIDQAQTEVQHVFPHYFERFKTDGIEHSIFIGQSLTPNLIFDRIYLYNLRLWQIQIMCRMVVSNTELVKKLPYQIELTSLIFAYNYPINIHFRMDEKRFDVEGNNDIRYEVIKKRIDKAFNKHKPKERIVQQQHLTIVYLNEDDAKEYLAYLEFLQKHDYFSGPIEKIDIEDVQDITGLKALRIKINTSSQNAMDNLLSYSDMISERLQG